MRLLHWFIGCCLMNAVNVMSLVENYALRKYQVFDFLPIANNNDLTFNLQNRFASNKIAIKHCIYCKRNKRFSVYGFPWKKKELSWNFVNKNHLKTIKEKKLIKQSLRKAFNVWQRSSLLKFEETNNPEADILIDFVRKDHGDGFSFDGVGGVLAHAYPPSSGLGGDIHFDQDELWDFNGTDKIVGSVDFFSVALHEIGHSLGLQHTSVPEAVMNQNYRKFEPKLHDDDEIGIQEIYGFKSKWGPIFPSTTMVIPSDYEVPDTCNTSYDAIALIRNELFIFKRQYMWRLRNNVLLSGYPVKTRHLWNKLPKRFTNIDAVFENRIQKEIWFFIGIRYFVFNANQLKFKRRLTHLGLPKELKKIDAIFTWGRNNVTYIFSGENFWRLDDKSIKLREKNSKKVTVYWRNALEMDTAFQKDGKTYFFKNKVFYEFDDSTMKLNLRRPQFSSQFWMKCSSIG